MRNGPTVGSSKKWNNVIPWLGIEISRNIIAEYANLANFSWKGRRMDLFEFHENGILSKDYFRYFGNGEYIYNRRQQMEASNFETLKVVLAESKDDLRVAKVYDLLMSSKGIFHDGTVLDVKQAKRVYSRRAKMKNPKVDIPETLLRNLENIEKGKIVIYSIFLPTESYALFLSITTKALLGVIKSAKQNLKSMSSLIDEYRVRGHDVRFYHRFENGRLED